MINAMRHRLPRIAGVFLHDKLFFLACLWVVLLLRLFTFSGTQAPVSLEEAVSPLVDREQVLTALREGRVPPRLVAWLGFGSLGIIALLAAGLSMNLRAFIRRRWDCLPGGESPKVPWDVTQTLKTAVYFLALLLSFLVLEGAAVSALERGKGAGSPYLLILTVCVQYALALGLVVRAVRRWGYAFPSLSAHFSSAVEQFGQALRIYIFFFPAFFLLLFLSSFLNQAWGLRSVPDSLVAPLLARGEVSLTVLLLAVGVVLGPLAEEIVFRGFFYPALKKRLAIPGAILLTAALFSTL
ncbi:MAG: CPBP family intramembrane metalloprotease, partial [Candidatus Aureabacteria bacterium]|nr:CPBP family intramembrane metalloprotease [Candidatus Auribacterota bacterium]